MSSPVAQWSSYEKNGHMHIQSSHLVIHVQEITNSSGKKSTFSGLPAVYRWCCSRALWREKSKLHLTYINFIIFYRIPFLSKRRIISPFFSAECSTPRHSQGHLFFATTICSPLSCKESANYNACVHQEMSDLPFLRILPGVKINTWRSSRDPIVESKCLSLLEMYMSNVTACWRRHCHASN